MSDATQPITVSGVEADESPALDKLAAALAKAQAAVQHADKSREAPVNREGTKKRKYATLADVMDAARPALAANGLSIVQHPSGSGGDLVLTTWLLHESGQWMRSRLSVPYVANAFMSETQALGSAITYCRRYAWAAIAGVAVEDDDAESTKEAGGAARSESSGAVFPYGELKGQPIAGADKSDLEWLAGAMRKAIADPAKDKFKAQNSALLVEVERELDKQKAAQKPAASPYAEAMALAVANGWTEENAKHWLKAKRGKTGSSTVTAEDVAELRKALEPPQDDAPF